MTITVPRGCGAYLRIAYLDGASGAFLDPLPGCRDQAGPPCVVRTGRIHDLWNPYTDGDLLSVVRFTGDATFGRER